MERLRFSAHNRAAILEQMASKTYDLLVIGGGITGAGIALDAAARGLKTALVEKNDFAHGSSSRSTKLVHGGLRYLKNLEINLVRELGRERAILHRNARHLVQPEPMFLPIAKGGSIDGFWSSAALWMYDNLAEVAEEEQFKVLSKQQAAAQEPMFRKDALVGGRLYTEYRTDDARLTIEILKTAHQLGADCINYLGVTSFLHEDGNIVGILVRDFEENATNSTYSIRANITINATGIWCDEIRALENNKFIEKSVSLTKGVHIVVPYRNFPLRQAVYFDTFLDKRMIFAIPRGEVTYIGTTDTIFSDNLDKPTATFSDISYLLQAVNTAFPEVGLTPEAIVSTWAGVRPLVNAKGKSISELSRKDEIFVSPTGLVSIVGGKLTGYRKMAERAVNLAVERLQKSTLGSAYQHIKPCLTADLKIGGGQFESQDELARFIAKRTGEVKQIGWQKKQVVDLVQRYGAETDTVVEIGYELAHEISDPLERLLVAELFYCIENEMVTTINDYLVRRTGQLYFDRSSLKNVYPLVADHLGRLLNWSESKKLRALAIFKTEYEKVMDFLLKK